MYPRIFAFLTVVIVLTAPLRAQEVVGFTLIDASTDQEIRPLRDGDTIDFKTEGAELNIAKDRDGNSPAVRHRRRQAGRLQGLDAAPRGVSADGHPVRRRERRTGQGQDDRLYGRRNAKT
ncbi:MAG: hypothetical protein ACYTEL_22650, partial [Planctomycetota bacterium]